MENKQPVGINMNMCDDKEIVIPSVNREFINYLKDHPYENKTSKLAMKNLKYKKFLKKRRLCRGNNLLCQAVLERKCRSIY